VKTLGLMVVAAAAGAWIGFTSDLLQAGMR
jgi:hypothetical protein